MATLGTIFGGSFLAVGGKKTETGPPIEAGSSDEEKFIKCVPLALPGGHC
jgi:F-type H+-transporting ATPase subunit k